jgi:hypothetical protein
LPPERKQHHLRARIGAFRLHATHDPRETTAAARAAFLARFEREVDPNGVLPSSERTRRAEAAKKAYFARLAYLSARARRPGKKKGDPGQRRAKVQLPAVNRLADVSPADGEDAASTELEHGIRHSSARADGKGVQDGIQS